MYLKQNKTVYLKLRTFLNIAEKKHKLLVLQTSAIKPNKGLEALICLQKLKFVRISFLYAIFYLFIINITF